MFIRKSRINDLPRIMELYAHAREFMAANGNPRQWGPNKWPPEELIRNDIKEGDSYVCEHDGKVCAVFYFICGKDIEPTYARIDGGKWLSDEPYGVVHRIASSGDVKGAGSFCLNWAFEQCRHLRIDTHEDNKVMQKLVTKLGFRYCGIIYVHEDNDPRLAYEKLL
ncbi:MAG: GNAT family N-acetyltransferase [Lachnospiraceae bacterium]|nr:GNAT family N-acetyltransferase [Lachnospiraceae bacterium]